MAKNSRLQSGMQGAMAGGSMGAAAGPWGAGAGAVAGGVMGAVMGGEESPWWDDGWFNDRKNQIEEFEKRLATARADYRTRLQALQANAFNRFSGDLESKLASRGLQVSGGAFGSGAGRRASELQEQLESSIYGAEREDLTNAENMRGNLFSAKVGAKTGQANLGYAASQASSRSFSEGMGGLSGIALSHVLAKQRLKMMQNSASGYGYAAPNQTDGGGNLGLIGTIA